MNPKELIKLKEKEIEVKKKIIKFRNCLVCRKQYPIRRSDTIRYCSRGCSDVAERVRSWENKRGMDLRVKQGQLKALKEMNQIWLDRIDDNLANQEALLRHKYEPEEWFEEVLGILDDYKEELKDLEDK